MDAELKEQLIRTMMRFRKIGMAFPADLDIRMGEIMIMNGIAGHFPPGMRFGDEKCQFDEHKKTFVSELQKMHHITKPAISQMLNGLENKGYISREMDRQDRRKVSVTLTQKGEDILKRSKEYADNMLDKTISRFGEDNTRKLIELFSQLVDISEQIRNETER
ncbi:MAG: MarR family transcriptional regulator, partial [Eubacteriaceae bacterium]|nr:MarR family transcriptional regulator [Eubacteriaceae bacterium]